MNKVMLLGRLTRDPEYRMSSSNLEITRFSLACNSDVVSRNAENNVEFINCVAFRNTATAISKFCVKGTLIMVIGRLHNSSYTAQDGTKRYSTEVTVESFEFTGSSNKNTNSELTENSYNKQSNYSGSNNFNSQTEFNQSYKPSYENNVSAVAEPSVVNEPIKYEDQYKNIGDDITISSDDLPF